MSDFEKKLSKIIVEAVVYEDEEDTVEAIKKPPGFDKLAVAVLSELSSKEGPYFFFEKILAAPGIEGLLNSKASSYLPNMRNVTTAALAPLIDELKAKAAAGIAKMEAETEAVPEAETEVKRADTEATEAAAAAAEIATTEAGEL